MMLLICLIGCIVFTCISAFAQVKSHPTLVPYNDGTLSIEIPSGWEVKTWGWCPSYSFTVFDPNPSNRTGFGSLGYGIVVYKDNAHRERDIRYAKTLQDMGSSEEQINSRLPYLKSPVVEPFTPENYLKAVLKTNPNCTDVKILSTTPLQPFILNYPGGVIHYVAAVNSEVQEGICTVRLIPWGTFAYDFPGYGGLGSAASFGYIYAPQPVFHSVAPLMQQSFSTAKFSQKYVKMCMQALAQQGQTSQQISQTLSEASDIIWDVYQQRDKSEDIIGAQWGDTTQGYIRIYDEITGNVYRVDRSWYDDIYDPGRDQYSMSGLYPLTRDQTDLYLKPPLTADEIR